MGKANATKIGDFFERRTRNPKPGETEGAVFYTLRDGAPAWLQDAIYDAHGGTAPNDWIYDECRAACDAIGEGSLSDDDDLHEHSDGRVDVYTRVLYQWAADMCLTDTYASAESAAEDMGMSEETDMVKRLMTLQYCAIESIARTMLEAVREHADDDDSEESEASAV